MFISVPRTIARLAPEEGGGGAGGGGGVKIDEWSQKENLYFLF